MSQNVTEIRLSKHQEDAARLVFDDNLSDEQIAAKIGITRRTLARWKLLPEFIARIDLLRQQTRLAILTQGVADKVSRIGAYNDRWQRMQQVITQRQEEYRGRGIAGGESGLLVHTVKAVGSGPAAYTVDEYAVDTGLLREMREIEKQAAIEIGDWVEKRNVKTDAKELLSKLLGVPPDALPDSPNAQ
jgi:predicted DNA-binding protein (UPF0251 family)